jgi:hypothetical protein
MAQVSTPARFPALQLARGPAENGAMSRTTLGAFLVTGLLALAGCGGTDQITEQAVEDASGGEVKIDKDGDKTKIKVGGQELENQQGGLVDGFPEDFPMPDGFEVETSTKTQGKYQAFGSISSSDETFAFYKDALAGDGWRISVASTAGPGSFQIVANKGGREAVVGASPANDGANLTILVG